MGIFIWKSTYNFTSSSQFASHKICWCFCLLETSILLQSMITKEVKDVYRYNSWYSELTSVRFPGRPAEPRSLWRSACWGPTAKGCGCFLNLQPGTSIKAANTHIHLHALQSLRILRVICTFRGVLIQARWVKWESTDTPTTSQLTSWNSLALSLNEMISVGHTNVLKTAKTQELKGKYDVFSRHNQETMLT